LKLTTQLYRPGTPAIELAIHAKHNQRDRDPITHYRTFTTEQPAATARPVASDPLGFGSVDQFGRRRCADAIGWPGDNRGDRR
jgi:hypothetical protein